MTSRQLIPLLMLEVGDQRRIDGRTRFQKLVFLLQKNAEELPAEYEFEAYDYGPFSKDLYDDLDVLAEQHLISVSTERTNAGEEKYVYELTHIGQRKLDEEFGDNRPSFVETVEALHDEFYTMPVKALIDFVYAEWPEMAKNSVL